MADQPGRNAPRAPCVSGHAFLAKPDFNFLSRVHFFSFLFVFLDGSDRPRVVRFFFFPSLIGRLGSPMYRALYFLSSCRISVFSAFVSFMCETEKNKKALQQFLKSLIFPPYQLHVIFPYALYMSDFLFYRSQVERETFCSSFSSLNSYMSRFLRYSKICTKLPKFAESHCFR